MIRLEQFSTDAASKASLDHIRSLCDAAFDGRFSDDDWAHSLGGSHVIGLDDAQIVAHASVVARPLRIDDLDLRAGYVEAVATAQTHQRRGLGSAVMRLLQTAIVEQFELGALSTGQHGFYEQLGWERWRGTTYVGTSDGVIRTPEEDDGIMVFRFGRVEHIDLTASLTCEERAGDDW